MSITYKTNKRQIHSDVFLIIRSEYERARRCWNIPCHSLYTQVIKLLKNVLVSVFFSLNYFEWVLAVIVFSEVLHGSTVADIKDREHNRMKQALAWFEECEYFSLPNFRDRTPAHLLTSSPLSIHFWWDHHIFPPLVNWGQHCDVPSLLLRTHYKVILSFYSHIITKKVKTDNS